MPQERLAGPEYFDDFDPEAFARKLREQAAQRAKDAAAEDPSAPSGETGGAAGDEGADAPSS